jgi:hypothetical protein
MILFAIGVALLLAIVVPVIVIVRSLLQQQCCSGGTGAKRCGGTARQAPRPRGLSYIAFHKAATIIARRPIRRRGRPRMRRGRIRPGHAATLGKNQTFAVSIGFDSGRFVRPAARDFSGGTAF